MKTTTAPHHPEYQEFRLFLQNELIRRCEKNPGYSLRSFARSLKMHPATLSHILRGKRKLSNRALHKICTALALSPEQIARFENSVSQKNKNNISSLPLKNYNNLTVDTFHIISEWYHYAILELMRIKTFSPNPRWIAKTLGLTINEVSSAVERLKRLEMLEVTKDGQWINTSGNNSNLQPNNFTSVALRKFQKQILEKAILAMEEIPLGKREQSSMTFAMDAARMPIAIDRIKEFRRSLCQELDQGGPYNEVMHLSVSLYGATNFWDEGF